MLRPYIYDARKVNRLRQFATSNTLQILVINIDAFRKNFTGTEEEREHLETPLANLELLVQVLLDGVLDLSPPDIVPHPSDLLSQP